MRKLWTGLVATALGISGLAAFMGGPLCILGWGQC